MCAPNVVNVKWLTSRQFDNDCPTYASLSHHVRKVRVQLRLFRNTRS